MKKICVFLVIAFMSAPGAEPATRASDGPQTVVVNSGGLTLHGLIWRPLGKGPFPAIMFNQGSSGTDDPMPSDGPAILGPVFARHGYVFLFLFRQGIGLSAGQGTADGDQMARALAAGGQEGRNRVQLQLLETEELNEARAGLEWLRARPEVDPRRVAIVGHSFGGSLTVLLAARETALRAVVVFSGSAASWGKSPELRKSLLAAVRQISAPVLFIHAANDYSLAPGEALAAEMLRLNKPCRLKIYPALGRTPRDGHSLIYRSVATWEPEVFGFLDAHLQRHRNAGPNQAMQPTAGQRTAKCLMIQTSPPATTHALASGG